MKKLLVLVLMLNAFGALAQGEDKFITFTGFVIDGKNDQPLPGTYIINEGAGRGVITNGKGFFSIDVYPGDSLNFRFIGYKAQYHIIPKNVELTYSAVVELQEDSKMLREVKVYPFRNEKEFKEALVAMELPDAKIRENLEKNLGRDRMLNLVAAQAMGAGGNYRYAMEQQATLRSNQYTTPVLSLTSPMAWINFIKGIKNGEYKAGANKDTYRPYYGEGTRDNIFDKAD